MLLALPPATRCHGEEMPRIVPSASITPEVLKEKRSEYRKTLTELALKREALQRRYVSGGAAVKTETIAEARSLLRKSLLTEIFPAWDGTPWDFNGISEVPGEGAIACGYFVTTTLRDLGFKLPRIKLAQQPSQTIIRSLCEEKTIRVFDEKPLDTIVTYLEKHGAGIYIVGLDCHTGFVVHDGTSMAFIHSSYFRPPRAVISEPIDSDNPLKRSKYRMIGKLFGDDLVRKWLGQETVVMKKH
jgi:hypothetical protein